MKYLMILLMSVGLCTFSMAQDNNNWDAKAPHDESMDNSSNNSMDNSSLNQSESSSSSSVIQPGMVEKEQVTTVNTTEKKNGLAGTIVKAPFKFVGYTVYGVGKGVGTIGKGAVKGVKDVGVGVGKGTARIVAAPFRAIGKAFDRNKRTEVTTASSTNVNVTPSSVTETESSSSSNVNNSGPAPEMNSSENTEMHDSKAPMEHGSM